MTTQKPKRLRKIAIAGGTAALAATLAFGTPIVLAQNDDQAPSVEQQAPGDRTPPFQTVLDELVANGTLTQEQADTVRDALQAKHKEKRGERRGPKLDVVAQAIGIDVDTLKDQLKEGKTLTQIAEENNADPAAVADAIVNAINERIDQAVADGKMDQEKADEIKANAPEKVEKMMNGERPEGEGGRHRGPRRGGFEGGPRDSGGDTA